MSVGAAEVKHVQQLLYKNCQHCAPSLEPTDSVLRLEFLKLSHSQNPDGKESRLADEQGELSAGYRLAS